MKIKKAVALGAAAAVALAGLALAPAFAEPVSNSYVLVGSDTLQDSTNALTNGTVISGAAVRVSANGRSLGSFDAFGSAQIQTKPNGPYFGRPAGSGSGVLALRASITGNAYAPGGTNPTPAKVITGQVDIARSSSSAASNSDGKLLYVPYARDAVAYAYKGGNATWASLSATQLKQIFDGTLTNVGGAAIKPRLPQAGSGTRNFFLSALGYSGTTAPGVSDQGNATAENDASVLADGEIIPFSVASWVAQANGATSTNSTTLPGVALGTPIPGSAPYTGTAPSLVPSPAFYASTAFGRDTYLVVERARVTPNDPKFDAGLATLIDPAVATSLTNFGSGAASSGAVKRKFGFLPPSTTAPFPAVPTL